MSDTPPIHNWTYFVADDFYYFHTHFSLPHFISECPFNRFMGKNNVKNFGPLFDFIWPSLRENSFMWICIDACVGVVRMFCNSKNPFLIFGRTFCVAIVFVWELENQKRWRNTQTTPTAISRTMNRKNDFIFIKCQSIR